MKTIVYLLLAYLSGSIPSAVWIGKLFFHKDLRNYGSGNMGTTNAFRVLGKKAGFSVLVCDVLKGFLPVLIARQANLPIDSIWIVLAAVLGHVYPIFAQFRGGKAMATVAGAMLAYNPLLLGIGLAVFLSVLFISSMVSLASMTCVGVVMLLTYFTACSFLLRFSITALFAFIVWRHRTNIGRIIRGSESKVPFGLGHKGKK